MFAKPRCTGSLCCSIRTAIYGHQLPSWRGGTQGSLEVWTPTLRPGVPEEKGERRKVLPENEAKICALLNDTSLAEQVMALIRSDESERRAALVQRQTEGLQKAKARGVRLGRPRAKRPKQFSAVYAMFLNHEISARAAAKMLDVSAGTFKRWVQAAEDAGGI